MLETMKMNTITITDNGTQKTGLASRRRGRTFLSRTTTTARVARARGQRKRKRRQGKRWQRGQSSHGQQSADYEARQVEQRSSTEALQHTRLRQSATPNQRMSHQGGKPTQQRQQKQQRQQ